MNINFSGNDLYNGFNLAAGIVPSSAIKNVLKGVKVESRNNRVEFTATDLEVLVKYRPSVKECAEEGSIVLPAVRVTNVLREWAGNEDVLMSVEGSACLLKSKGGYFKIAGEDAGQFPDVVVPEAKDMVEIDGEVVSDMARRVMHSVSTVKVRSAFCGVFIRILGEDIVMVAADGNRMSCIKRKVHNSSGVSMDGIIAVKCLTYLQRFVAECRGMLRIGIGEFQIRFAGEKGEVISQLIDGQYPRYEYLLPVGNDRKVEVNRNELLSGVRMASFMTNEGYRVVKLVFKDGKLRLVSRAADVGEAEIEVAVSYEGSAFEISFNPDYVVDALKSSDSETVTMEFGGSDNAALFRTGHEQVEVIMPIER